MRYRPTITLFVLFLTALGALIWAERARVPDREKRREILNRLLPELIDTPVTDIQRIEVTPGPGAEPGKKPLIVERRPGGAWQITRPVDTAADANLVETLARNLKDLRKSADAGTILGDPTQYGLDKPAKTVRIYARGPEGSATKPLVSLDIGKTERKLLFVRPEGDPGVEVVDSVLLQAVDLPLARWRDPGLIHVPSFRVAEVLVNQTGEGKPPELGLRRDERHWRLFKPIKAPAEDEKAEGLVAELGALRVAPEADGYVKDDATAADREKYGLDKPALKITVTPFPGQGAAQSIEFGSAVPGKPDEVYAVRGGQDDIVRVDVKRLRESIPGLNGLRSQKVLDMIPQRLSRLKIDARGKTFDLARTAKGWNLLSPVNEPADSASIQALVMGLADLKAAEFMEPGRIKDLRLDPPLIRVRGWQAEPGKVPLSEGRSEPDGEARFDLAIGRHDLVRKSIYGRVAGDTSVLVMPDAILQVLPLNDFAYRDKTVLTLRPEAVRRLSVEREGKTETVEAPGAHGAANQWKLVEPNAAKADNETVTALIVTLSNLRAEAWESDKVGDGKEFGLDSPALRINWSTGPEGSAAGGTLRVGKKKANSTAVYANLEGDPRVFSLNSALLVPFEVELRDKSIMTFQPSSAERLVFRWPDKTVTLNRYPKANTSSSEWQPALGFESVSVEPARVDALVKTLGQLKTTKFLSHSGAFPAESGLDRPSLGLDIKLKGEDSVRTLKIGKALGNGTYAATNSATSEGPVFLLSADGGWDAWVQPPQEAKNLPLDVFGPLKSGK